MAYGTVSADVIQSSVANTSLGAGNSSIMKNRIINGAMVIDQRNAGASIANPNGYCLDRWNLTCQSGSGHTVQAVADAPANFLNSVKVTVGTGASPSSSQQNIFFQPVEGYNVYDLNFGSANALTTTLSFWVKSSVTGTMNVWIQNGASTRAYVSTYTVNSANTWEYKTITLTGDTTGTWLKTTGTGMLVGFSLGMGTNFNASANTWSAGDYKSTSGATSVIANSGATWQVTGVQLEVGSSATGYEYVNYQTLLANCQRYYQKITDCKMIGAFAGTNTVARLGSPLMVQMRTSPSMSVTGSITLYNPAVGVATITSLGGTYSSINSFDFDATLATGSGFTNGSVCIAYVSGSYSINASAEL